MTRQGQVGKKNLSERFVQGKRVVGKTGLEVNGAEGMHMKSAKSWMRLLGALMMVGARRSRSMGENDNGEWNYMDLHRLEW